MIQSMRAAVVPYSSIVGTSITLHTRHGETVVAQLAVLTPAGQLPGEDQRAFAERIAHAVADAINAHGMARQIVEDIADMDVGDVEMEHREIIARCRAEAAKWEDA